MLIKPDLKKLTNPHFVGGMSQADLHNAVAVLCDHVKELEQENSSMTVCAETEHGRAKQNHERACRLEQDRSQLQKAWEDAFQAATPGHDENLGSIVVVPRENWDRIAIHPAPDLNKCAVCGVPIADRFCEKHEPFRAKPDLHTQIEDLKQEIEDLEDGQVCHMDLVDKALVSRRQFKTELGETKRRLTEALGIGSLFGKEMGEAEKERVRLWKLLIELLESYTYQHIDQTCMRGNELGTRIKDAVLKQEKITSKPILYEVNAGNGNRELIEESESIAQFEERERKACLHALDRTIERTALNVARNSEARREVEAQVDAWMRENGLSNQKEAGLFPGLIGGDHLTKLWLAAQNAAIERCVKKLEHHPCGNTLLVIQLVAELRALQTVKTGDSKW